MSWTGRVGATDAIEDGEVASDASLLGTDVLGSFSARRDGGEATGDPVVSRGSLRRSGAGDAGEGVGT
ncbi:hypothetical protein ABTX35_38295, partial [Streptomyces sp. NPDC096080]|uniref:hypothetical protein n=1 Tax=Streptomyces sp. NPDC096080 TaxID=3156693 RepID=UPI00332EEF71